MLNCADHNDDDDDDDHVDDDEDSNAINDHCSCSDKGNIKGQLLWQNNCLTALRMSFILQRYTIGLRDEDETKNTKLT